MVRLYNPFATAAKQARGLDDVGHRPWPLPDGAWRIGQSWLRLLFMHWAVPEEVLRPHIPRGLELDLFEGGAWLGITPFRLEGMRPRGVPPAPLLCDFLEANSRTYVTAGGKPGIWFFTLDASSRLAAAGGRLTYYLPYRHVQMTMHEHGGRYAFASERLRVRYGSTGPPRAAASGSIEHFLTERLSKTGKRMVGDKTPLFTPKILSEISVVYPEAKVIHLIRDGRDQAVSWMHHLWRSAKDQGGIFDLEPEESARRDAFHQNPQEFLISGEGIYLEKRLRSTAEAWKIRVGTAIEDGPTLLGAHYVEVRYEDLLEKPEEEARRLFEFLGADASEETVNRCVESASFEKLSGRERGQENYTLDFRKHRKGIAGDWQNVFTEEDKRIFKEEAGDLLIKLGYEESNQW